MKNKKIIIIVSLIISLIIIFLIIHPSVLRTPSLNRGGWNTNQIVPKALSERNIKVSLIILDKKYETEIKEGSTVYDAMKSIESVKDNNFSFKTKEYSSLGIFVDRINGLKGGSGGYWIYSVNGKEASVSVSKYKINNGDIISWKYEK